MRKVLLSAAALCMSMLFGVSATCVVTVSIAFGIENINVLENAVIYDLSGRRVTKMTRGIYIVNGKKVFVK